MRDIAMITGGAGGMGLSTAQILGRDHQVVVVDVNQVRLDAAVAELSTLDVDVLSVRCDITDRDSVRQAFSEARRGGILRAVVHTAGVSPQMGSGESILRINALGTVNVTEAFLDTVGEGGVLVNVASLAGHLYPRVLVPAQAYRLALTDTVAFMTRMNRLVGHAPRGIRSGLAYSLSKNFVIWYSQTMAAAFGMRGARVLSVSPGSFDTSMGRLEEKSGSGRMLDYAALQRFGKPEEVAELLAFCASGKPGYLTGTDILCDGGTKAGIGLKDKLALARAF